MGGKIALPLRKEHYDMMEVLWRTPEDVEMFYDGRPTGVFRNLAARKYVVKQFVGSGYYWALTGYGEEALIDRIRRMN